MNNSQPKTTTTTSENEQTITFTKNEAGTGTLMGWTKTTSRKKSHREKTDQRTEEKER